MPTNLHDVRDVVETIVTFGGAIGFFWGFIKFASKIGALKDVPEKMDNLTSKVDTVDRKVENLTGQFEIFKVYGGRK